MCNEGVKKHRDHCFQTNSKCQLLCLVYPDTVFQRINRRRKNTQLTQETSHWLPWKRYLANNCQHWITHSLWPCTSPDLNLCDLKNRANVNKLYSLYELKTIFEEKLIIQGPPVKPDVF